MAKSRLLTLAATLTLLATGAGTAAADTVSEDMGITNDSETSFTAEGSFTTIDNGANDGLGSAPFTIDFDDGPPRCRTAAVCWEFTLKHVADGWTASNPPTTDGGVTQGGIGAKGKHIIPPAAHGEGENILDDGMGGFAMNTMSWAFGKTGSLSISRRKAHGKHVDKWSVHAKPKAVEGAAGGPNRLTGGTTTVQADHIEDTEKVCLPSKHSAGSSSSSSTITFDEPSGMLSFTPGSTDILDAQGGSTGTVDVEYLGDPVVSATWAIDDIQLIGLVSGRYQFTGGTVTLTDPSTQFDFSADFAEFLIGDTTSGSVDSYGLFETTLISDVGDDADGPSGFLSDFIDNNLLGKDQSSVRFARIRGPGLTIATPGSLVTATNGFTQSAAGVPATLLITACDSPSVSPALSREGMVALAVLMIVLAGALLRWQTGTPRRA